MPEELASEDGMPRNSDADFAEQPDLLVVQRMVRRVGAGEMAHQQREAVVFGLDARRDRRRLVEREAEPVHAGIDVQRRAAAPALAATKRVPLGELGACC